MKKMKLIYLPIDKVIPYERNNQIHTEDDIKQLAAMIDRLGFDVPIVVDENYVLIKGHKRRLAEIQRGSTEIMAIVRDDMSEADKKAARIADNKVSKRAEDDIANLIAEFEWLKANEYDLDFTGFQEAEIEAMFSGINANIESIFADTIEDGAFLKTLNDKSDHFQVTFMFDNEHKELIEGVIKLEGKDAIKDKIIEYCNEVANA